MAETITIQEVEAAINFYLTRSATTGTILSSETRVLAELYGLMIYRHEKSVEVRNLTPEQQALIEQAAVIAPPADIEGRMNDPVKTDSLP